MTEAQPTSPAATPRRFFWRRLVQYRLRTLFAVTAVVAVLFAWWSHTARRQREAVAALRKSTFVVVKYEFEDFDAGLFKKYPRYWPKWIVDWLGIDYFSNVERITVVTGRPFSFFSDEDLVPLINLQTLRDINLQDTEVTDAGLENLKLLTNLQKLNLTNTRVTNTGIARLQKALPNCTIER